MSQRAEADRAMPEPRQPSDDSQAGFTIIETMVAAVLLLVGLVATLTIVEQAASVTVATRTREQATSLQRELVEAVRSVAYDQLTPNGVGAAVRARPALGDSALGAAGWTVRRRNADYTVSIGVCTVDDPSDGIGAHQAGVFCAAGASPPEDANADGTVDGLASGSATSCASPCPDTNPADFKRVVSLVRWRDGRSNVQTTQISNPGVAAAPAIVSLTAPSLTAPYTIPDTRTSLGLAITWTGVPSSVALYLDGTQIGTLTAPAGTSWSTAWTLGDARAAVGLQPIAGVTIVDGTYELSAKAFDRYLQYGATRSETVVVNRRQTFAPANVEAGRNGAGVEIEWTPAKERDSKGFRVDRRVNGGAWVEACAMAVRTACRDTGAPAAAPGTVLEYSVIGFDLDPAGALRAGDRSASVLILDLPGPVTPVAPPPTLAATLVNGNVELTWTAPAGPVPDHYNIYRDGQAYGDRLDSAYIRPGDPLTYVDTGTTGQPHDYWITAVDGNLRESVKTGPVRR